MSLINDMLQDLDRETPQEKPALPAGLAAKKADAAASPRRLILPGLAVVAVIYALVVEMNLFGLMPEQKKPIVDIPEPVALNSKWLHVKPAETPAAVVIETVPISAIAEEIVTVDAEVDTIVPEQRTSPAAVPATNSDINTSDNPAVTPLLEAAARALAANQLTTPVGNNAYELFKSVLVIDPQNADAIAGIESIRQRYVWWLEQALDQGRVPAAQMYAHKAKNVGVDAATLALYADRLNPHVAAAPAEIPVTETLAQASITPAKMASDAEVAERLRVMGLRAETEALRLITQARAATQTAVALSDLYTERQARGELRHLANLLADRPTEKTQSAYAYVAAQLWILDGQEKRAAEALASVEFDGYAERQRQRLLAGLQQKAGDYGAAMTLYADLVSASPESVSDWLGLAVSADRSKLSDTALDAYEKVLLLRHPDPRVMQFARQRQQDLSLSMTNR